MKSQIVISGALHPSIIERFEANPSFKITYIPDCSRSELEEKIKNAHVLVSRSETNVDKELIDVATNLKVIARAAVGVGNIDIEYATNRGILVLNCPGKNTNSAAELTMGLLICMMRNIPQAHQHLKTGGWDRHMFSGNELRHKKIGLVGLGNVGHRVAKFCRGFDMELYGYDPYISPLQFEKNHVQRVESLAELAETVDVLTVHVPLNKETRGMVNQSILQRMQPGSFVINAARGGVISENDLLAALNHGNIVGAGIDTWENEPKPLAELLNHPKVWVTPHIGATTVEAQLAIGESVLDQVENALGGGVVDHPVNLPNVGIIDNQQLKSYAVLAEKLGSILGQIIDFNPVKFDISYRGNIADNENKLVRLGFLKGYASQVVDGLVSFVNVEKHVEKMGIRVEEIDDSQFDHYKSAIKILVTGPQDKKITLGGVVFDDNYLRLTLLNDFYFELEPDGEILVIQNYDRPGVIGDVGQFLANNKINIDSFTLSRNKKGGEAMALVRVDSSIPTAKLDELSQIKNLISVKQISL